MKKKILILGNSAKEYALAKKLSEKNEVFVAPGNDGIREFATCLDIRDTNCAEIIDYVMENNIDMTIPVSNMSYNTNIPKTLMDNGFSVFAPINNGSKLIFDKAYAKKLLYKLKIPTPRFGIFEKQSMINDYIKNLSDPFVIKTTNTTPALIFTSFHNAKNTLEAIYTDKNSKIIIEDYIDGSYFTFYAITDGYKALPLGSTINYKHSLEGNGGQLTSGMGACSPNYKLSFQNEKYIMNKVIYPTLQYLESENNPYTGIIGIDGVLTSDEHIKILGYTHFMQDYDCAGLLANLDLDLYGLFNSCIIGSFSDDYDYIPQKNLYSTTIVLNCRNSDNAENIITGIDNIDDNIIPTYYNNAIKNKYLEFEANNGPVIALSSVASTVATATKYAYQAVEKIDFNGKRYRKDICKPINL
ncbi:MAG: hypothetical protein MJ237_00455 [bacterium]|nr:hypothetical protein [bacterium]